MILDLESIHVSTWANPWNHMGYFLVSETLRILDIGAVWQHPAEFRKTSYENSTLK